MGIQLRDLIGTRSLESIYVRDWASTIIIQIGIDGQVYRFVKRVDPPQSWLSAIQPLGEDNPIRHVEGTVFFDPPRVVEIRWRETSIEEDCVYALDEARNVVLFEVGSELDVEGDMMFVWEYVGPDGYTPTWLEAIDPDPPVEIKPKQKHAGDRRRKRTPTGHRAYPRST